ncbi:hypothetical protein AKJ09_02349 [Labilithrix luteola]|uniref:Uncharacterized protein n=1 Tax=Labilithrix luteola TaxID=1391654 RepID=A0A0K1PQ60_9BACT|nr:hypothetical protein AKJ09_02349 [Labilithrix luteola]
MGPQGAKLVLLADGECGLDPGRAPWFLASTWNDAVLWNDTER